MTEQKLDWLSGVSDLERDILGRGIAVTKSIVQDASRARSCWSLWEALNDRLGDAQLQQALDWYRPTGFGVLRQSLAECAILAVKRMTDAAGADDRLSVCQLAGILANDAVTKILATPLWVSRGETSSGSSRTGREVAAQPERIQWFRDRVPLGWSKGDRLPGNEALVRVRKSLRDIRDRRLTHSIRGDFEAPQIDEIRDGLRLASEIASTASLIFLGDTSGLDKAFEEKVRASHDVWIYFESGLVAAYKDRAVEVERTTTPNDSRTRKS